MKRRRWRFKPRFWVIILLLVGLVVYLGYRRLNREDPAAQVLESYGLTATGNPERSIVQLPAAVAGTAFEPIAVALAAAGWDLEPYLGRQLTSLRYYVGMTDNAQLVHVHVFVNGNNPVGGYLEVSGTIYPLNTPELRIIKG
ncbi:MAG: DUF4830 domain-containing protein [Bacillota bacterium]